MNAKILLHRLLLLFWSVYFSLVFASNLVNGFQEVGLAPSDWTFTSGNFALVAQSVSTYGSANGLAAFLFVALLVVQLATLLLFWMAVRDNWRSEEGASASVIRPFIPAVGLFTGFLIADELFIVYERIPTLETDHFLVLCGLLLSVLVLDR